MDELTTLAIAAGAGDRTALRALVRATHGDVWRLCAHLAGRDAADDLTQDVYLRAMRALPSFRAEASAKTWLLGIARRAAADAIRAQQRRRLLAKLVPSPRFESGDSGAVELEMLIGGLDTKLREAFVLTRQLGLTYAEAADICGCPIGTIRSRVARARDALQDALVPQSQS